MFGTKKTPVFMDTPKQTDRQTSKETLELPDLVNRHIKRPSKKDDDGHGAGPWPFLWIDDGTAISLSIYLSK